MTRFAKLAFVVAAATTAACSDSVGPRVEQSLVADDVQDVAGGEAATALTGSDTLRFRITIDPKKRSRFHLGAGNDLIFPKSSVCDPATSGYGEALWDSPCKAAGRPVTINVKAWLDAQGHPRTDFSPNIRFVPSNVAAQWVNITFADAEAAFDPKSEILYCKDVSTIHCRDESKKDPTLLTVRDPVTGQVTRRIKHFSGYLVGAGEDMSSIGAFSKIGPVVTPLPSLTQKPATAGKTQPSAKAPTSGYILVSG